MIGKVSAAESFCASDSKWSPDRQFAGSFVKIKARLKLEPPSIPALYQRFMTAVDTIRQLCNKENKHGKKDIFADGGAIGMIHPFFEEIKYASSSKYPDAAFAWLEHYTAKCEISTCVFARTD
jgi:hypothetical protein